MLRIAGKGGDYLQYARRHHASLDNRAVGGGIVAVAPIALDRLSRV